MDERDKLKNLKDLQYSRILNYQNLIVASAAGAIITAMFAEYLPSNLDRGS